MHDGRAELEVKVRLDALLGHRLCDALCVAALELAREQVVEPALEQGDDACRAGGRGREGQSSVGACDAAKEAKGDGPRMKKSQTRQPGCQKPTPGPLPTGPVLKR